MSVPIRDRGVYVTSQEHQRWTQSEQGQTRGISPQRHFQRQGQTQQMDMQDKRLKLADEAMEAIEGAQTLLSIQKNTVMAYLGKAQLDTDFLIAIQINIS